MTSTFEIANGILFITGSLDRGSDNDLAQALEKFAQATAPDNRVVDMSNVRWLSPSGAKVLIAAGQEAGEKGGAMRILASRHVMQTLNLLGAKTWLSIESCLTPNAKPVPEAPPAPAPVAAPAPAAAPAPKAGVATPKVEAAAPKTETPSAPAVEAPAHAAPVAPSAPASASGLIAAVSTQRPAGALAGAHEELSRGGQLLRVLYPNRRYSFHFAGGELILGLVRERVGGSWVIVETAGTRKIINLDMVEYCEIL